VDIMTIILIILIILYLVAPGVVVFPVNRILNESLYSSSNLESIIQKMTKDRYMGDYFDDFNHPRVVLTSTFSSGDQEPTLLRSYNQLPGKGKRYNEIKNVSLFDAARATSAAPLYFKPHTVGRITLVDGGVTANNPTEVCMDEAKSLWPDAKINMYCR